MATIVSSKYTTAVVQRDGRISVDEMHVDDQGGTWVLSKYLPPGTDLNAQLIASANQLLNDLQATEIANNVAQITTFGSLAVFTFNYSTQGQGLAAVREFYKTATQLQAIMIGDFFSSLTNPQLQNIFNMTLTQVQNLRANKLTPAANAANEVRNEVGQ